jgi:hypothetical protein
LIAIEGTIMTTLVDQGALTIPPAAPAFRRIASDVMLLAGVALLCAAAIALRLAVSPLQVIETGLALTGFSVSGVLGVLTIAAAVHSREPSE